ncbi:unnamed protein product [Adineta steineri]|uniref:MACPF-like domain-containing protein n=1 Tax=Adineta steineri TaxID=433720 RepID=A0A815MQ94_9BILA|nr:unnamed protein product [Adineta steineri]CAF1621554.1 unnamed protein product [Adineta steineri]
MTDNQPLIRIKLDDVKKTRLPLPQPTTTVAQFREELVKVDRISTNFYFLDADDYTINPEQEKSTLLRELLDEQNVVRLKSKENIQVPNKKPNSARERTDLNYLSANTQSITTSFQQPIIPGSIPVHSTVQPILANSLDLDDWKRVFDTCGLLCGIRMDEKEPIRAMQPFLKFKELNNPMPLIQVYDNSYICSYMRNKRMASSFVSNNYFDGSLEFSSPLLGIGIDMTYSKKNSTTSEQRTIYSTCVFNYPRVLIELNLTYLEATQSFIDDINYVLQNTPTKNDLGKVFSRYGHVYPQRVVLGGHLFHTEDHLIKGDVIEEEIRRNVEGRFRSDFFKQFEIHANSDSSNRSRQETNEQRSSITFQAVGGHTLLVHNPTAWEQTVTDPKLWRIIQQDDYKPVTDLLNGQQRRAIAG